MSIIEDIVRGGELPLSGKELIDFLTVSDGVFVAQEGVQWDFKGEWPTSHSDDYFLGLCRLICAFANTDGGIIVFGVDDKTRKSSRKPASFVPNVDKFVQAASNVLTVELQFQHRRYEVGQGRYVDCLLIPKRPEAQMPCRFKIGFPDYEKGIIWVRARHEVRVAQATDIPKLYLGSNERSYSPTASISLPPSPATLREFVGRMDCIDRVFHWLRLNDEPRQFLYGKGGSGKSTIAYEVATYLKEYHKSFRIDGIDIVDQIIYVSAKATYFDIEKLNSSAFKQNDFKSEKELYQSILTLGGFQIAVDQYNDISCLKIAIREFFNDNACFIVVDDIDTVTTAGEESGIDFLQSVLFRAKKRSKILYTVRNRPSHSIASSIEVPGLPDPEYDEFINACAAQFNVNPPDEQTRRKELSEISERRPLVLESVIALRRHCGTYKQAMDLFLQSDGDNLRNYVFEREWDALPSAEKGREILAMIALYGKPILFSELVAISAMDASRVRDAIAQTQEMFLIVETDGTESRYFMGELTRAFIQKVSRALDLWSRIEARVQMFKSTFYADSPVINQLVEAFNKAKYAMRIGDSSQISYLYSDLSSQKYGPKTAEDPRFLTLRGHVGILADIRNLTQSRSDFDRAFTLKSTPDLGAVLTWFDAERTSDMSDAQTQRIVELVSANKGYTNVDKGDVFSRRGVYLYNYARDNSIVDPAAFPVKMREAISWHMEALKMYLSSGDAQFSRSWEYCQNTAFAMGQNIVKSRRLDYFVDMLEELADKRRSLPVDPLAEPTLALFRRFVTLGTTNKELIGRAVGQFSRARECLADVSLWHDKDERTYFQKECRVVAKSLNDLRDHSIR